MLILKNIKLLINLNKKWLKIFLLIAIPRFVYIILTNNTTADSFFYLNIAENIKNGCGFSYSNSFSSCEPIIGGYFPAYPYFLYVLDLIGLGIKSKTIFVSTLSTLSFIYLLNTLNNIGLRENTLFKFAFLFGLSPLSIGYSRFILIDPVLYIFSILLLTEFIKLKYQSNNIRIKFFRIIIISILSIYFKPTSVIFVFPHFLLILNNYGIKKFIRLLITYILIISFSILPWLARDLKYGANKQFNMNSSVAPKNVKGLVNWIATFSITEYDHAASLYPIYSRKNGDRKKVIIRTKFNPFISKEDKDYKEVSKILNKENPEIIRGFTDEEEIVFNKLAESRAKNNGIFGNILLYLIKISGILLHPLNSWGWPISISLDARYSIFDFSLNLKLFFKSIIFLYRFMVFYFYFRNLFYFARRINFKNISSKRNHIIIKENIILISSFGLLVLNIFLYIGLFGLLEHRYFYPIIPWIEFSIFSKIFQSKIEKNNIFS
tara:strand:+ start:140 stop:1615 length:1476 start_codon:yes stop_codon:yes gene_type:complete